MAVLMKILQLVVALSALIAIHEAGHFFWARIFGIRVDKFFLFFDIGGVKLFSTRSAWFLKLFPKAASWKTEYGIGWLPLGGYCKIAGMVDESLDMESLKKEAQPWEFRSKKSWQRLLVMSGGVLNNFLLAIALFIAILAIWGGVYVPNDYPVYPNAVAREMGFRSGDRILKMDDYVPQDFLDLQADLARRQARTVTVLRGADTLTLYIDQSLIGAVLNSPGLFDAALPFVVDSLQEGSLNPGLKRGDRLLTLQGSTDPWLQDVRAWLQAHPDTCVYEKWQRGADTLTLPLVSDSTGRAGVLLSMPMAQRRSYSIAQAIPAGAKLAWKSVGGYLRDLRLVATPSTGAYKSVGSFVAIGEVFPSAWNWYQFLYILAMLSIMLGVMNLLPVPGLDGGHIVFCLWEMISGRKPSDRFMQIAQIVGMVLLLLLMMLAFGNDIGRLIN